MSTGDSVAAPATGLISGCHEVRVVNTPASDAIVKPSPVSPAAPEAFRFLFAGHRATSMSVLPE